MPLETTVNTIEQLNEAWPLGSDDLVEGDNHIRNIKKAVKAGGTMSGPLSAQTLSEGNERVYSPNNKPTNNDITGLTEDKQRRIHISTNAPTSSDGVDGDVWMEY